MKIPFVRRVRLSPPLESIPAPDNDALRKMVELISEGTAFDRKRCLFDMLDDACKFQCPKRMVEDEFRGIWRELMNARRTGRLDIEDLVKSERQLQAEYHAIADAEYALGLCWPKSGSAVELWKRNFLGERHPLTSLKTELSNSSSRFRLKATQRQAVGHDSVVGEIQTQAGLPASVHFVCFESNRSAACPAVEGWETQFPVAARQPQIVNILCFYI